MINLPCPLALCPLPIRGLCALWELYLRPTHSQENTRDQSATSKTHSAANSLSDPR